jgi:general secretion pathway protein G
VGPQRYLAETAPDHRENLTMVTLLGPMRTPTRSGRAEFTLVNAVMLAIVVAIAGAIGIPLIEKTSGRAQRAALLENLHTLRSQIELYKAEHGGEAPVLYQNTFPQLTRATNAQGIPGEPGSKYSYGPYLRYGVPVNPITGRSIVALSDTFPPTAASGNGGWIYHQESGRIAADLDEFLSE